MRAATRQSLSMTCDTLDRLIAGLSSLGIEQAQGNRALRERGRVGLGRVPRQRRGGGRRGRSRRLAVIEGLTGLGPHASVTDTITVGDAPPIVLRRNVQAFFQGNRYLLRDLVAHVTGLVPSGVDVLDLYAGAGLFAITAAEVRQARVTAVEGDRIAAADLAANAASHAGVAVHHQAVEEFLERAPAPAAVIVDPPRTGLSRAALDGVIRLRARRVVYVSCDVATLARDARRLVDAGKHHRACRRLRLVSEHPRTSKRWWCSARDSGWLARGSWLAARKALCRSASSVVFPSPEPRAPSPEPRLTMRSCPLTPFTVWSVRARPRSPADARRGARRDRRSSVRRAQAPGGQRGSEVSKDALIEAAWGDVAVTDNSLEQAISRLRRVLGRRRRAAVHRNGGAPRLSVHGAMSRASSGARPTQALDALLAPHRAWIEGRAALETLERDQIVHAREVFEERAAQRARSGIGARRAGQRLRHAVRDDARRRDAGRDALAMAAHHAREACRLDPRTARRGRRSASCSIGPGSSADALAASRRAVTLEPDNWRHHVRLSYVELGRGAAARGASHAGAAAWLSAGALAGGHGARRASGAGRGRAGARGRHRRPGRPGRAAPTRFSGVALHWLLGLIHLAPRRRRRALAEFERELSVEGSGHLYARECCANTWYAIGALQAAAGRSPMPRDAFSGPSSACRGIPWRASGWLRRRRRAAGRRPAPSAATGRRVLSRRPSPAPSQLVARGRHDEAARLVDDDARQRAARQRRVAAAGRAAAECQRAPDAWASALARLRSRAA